MKPRKRRDPGIPVRVRHKREAYPCRSLLLLFEFQRAAGLDRSFLSMVERGLQSPNLVVPFKLAEILRVPASELIVRTETALGSTPHPSADH